jgi:hypothetical protein
MLEALIEEAIVDAYGEGEQKIGLLTMMQEHSASADFETSTAPFIFTGIPLLSGVFLFLAVWSVRFGDGRLGPNGHEISHVIVSLSS